MAILTIRFFTDVNGLRPSTTYKDLLITFPFSIIVFNLSPNGPSAYSMFWHRKHPVISIEILLGMQQAEGPMLARLASKVDGLANAHLPLFQLNPVGRLCR